MPTALPSLVRIKKSVLLFTVTSIEENDMIGQAINKTAKQMGRRRRVKRYFWLSGATEIRFLLTPQVFARKGQQV